MKLVRTPSFSMQHYIQKPFDIIAVARVIQVGLGCYMICKDKRFVCSCFHGLIALGVRQSLARDKKVSLPSICSPLLSPGSKGTHSQPFVFYW